MRSYKGRNTEPDVTKKFMNLQLLDVQCNTTP